MATLDYAVARQNMVDSQLLPNRLTDERIIEAVSVLPRERFVPLARRSLSYADESLLLEDDRFLMQPMVLVRLIQSADIKPSDVVLTVGAGTGYAIAVLAKLADTVIAVEENDSLRQKAEKNLSELDIDNVVVVQGPLAGGHPDDAPYDVIFIDGAVHEVPEKIISQLSDRGRLVAVQQPKEHVVGQAVLITKFGDTSAKRSLFDASEPVLSAFVSEAGFSF